MTLHQVYSHSFFIEQEAFCSDYFFTNDIIGEPLARNRIWLVILIRNIEDGSFHLDKLLSILKQPMEVVEKIVQREALHFLSRLILSQVEASGIGV